MAWRVEPIPQAPNKTLDAWCVYEVPFDGLNAPWTRELGELPPHLRNALFADVLARGRPPPSSGLLRGCSRCQRDCAPSGLAG